MTVAVMVRDKGERLDESGGGEGGKKGVMMIFWGVNVKESKAGRTVGGTSGVYSLEVVGKYYRPSGIRALTFRVWILLRIVSHLPYTAWGVIYIHTVYNIVIWY